MSITAISPLDGRYQNKVQDLQNYFSEFALIKYRVRVEIQYLIALHNAKLPELNFSKDDINRIQSIEDNFSVEDAIKIKEIERTTNHDVKAVEYFIKNRMAEFGMEEYIEFVHFALTSQDINNTALPLMIHDALNEVIIPEINSFIGVLRQSTEAWWDVPMLARTHGQPASPTSLGKELMVFLERLEFQLKGLKPNQLRAKFGGATGQFNAHIVAYPNLDWESFANDFIQNFGIHRSTHTTQIGHYDDHSEVFDSLARIHTILIDLARDIWTYISINYFGQKTLENEVGSSAMPHKVNPIDFENAEGNLALGHAMLQFLSHKLPISRLQRDLTDSTVTRNVGVPFGHLLVALKSLKKGWSKLKLNHNILDKDLEENWAVVSEAIQNILRREKFDKPYEALKKLTRGKSSISKQDIHDFIRTLEVGDEVQNELLQITPQNYIGYIQKRGPFQS